MLHSTVVSVLYTVYHKVLGMVLKSLPVFFFCRGGSCCRLVQFPALGCALMYYWCSVSFSTDRASHGAGAGRVPQHTQETGYMSAGAGRHRCQNETWTCPLLFKLPGTHCVVATLLELREFCSCVLQKKLPLTALSQAMQDGGSQLGEESLIG